MLNAKSDDWRRETLSRLFLSGIIIIIIIMIIIILYLKYIVILFGIFALRAL